MAFHPSVILLMVYVPSSVYMANKFPSHLLQCGRVGWPNSPVSFLWFLFVNVFLAKRKKNYISGNSFKV